MRALAVAALVLAGCASAPRRPSPAIERALRDGATMLEPCEGPITVRDIPAPLDRVCVESRPDDSITGQTCARYELRPASEDAEWWEVAGCGRAPEPYHCGPAPCGGELVCVPQSMIGRIDWDCGRG